MKGFAIYGRSGDLGHVTWTIYIYFSPFRRRLHIKFGFDWPSACLLEKIFEIGGHIHVCSRGTWADNPGGQNFSLTFIQSIESFAANFPHLMTL